MKSTYINLLYGLTFFNKWDVVERLCKDGRRSRCRVFEEWFRKVKGKEFEGDYRVRVVKEN